MDRNVLTLSSGQKIEFQFLIGADGVNSQVAKRIFGSSFNPNSIGFGLEVEVPRDRLPQQSDTVEIDFCAAKWGYGWVFPKQQTFTIGVGGIHRLNPNLKERLKQYLSQKHLDISEFHVKGQYIPFGDFRTVPGRTNVLLCGDAAGVVDPITGEGIAYALQSGHTAGKAVIEAKAAGTANEALNLYQPEFQKISKSIRQANMWRYLIFPSALQRPFAWAFSDAGTLQKGYLDILAGKHDYNALYRIFAVQVLKALRKPFVTITSKLFGRRESSLK